MLFISLSAVLLAACSAITVKTLVGYTPMRKIYKVAVSLVVTAGWFAPFVTAAVWRLKRFSPETYAAVWQYSYLLFGVCFLLLCLILARDFVWFAVYKFMKWREMPVAGRFDPMNPRLIVRANLAVLVLSAAGVLYGWHEGTKMPVYKHVVIETPKLSEPFTIAVLSDLHINPATSPERVGKIVEKTNAMKPDAVILAGDTVDAFPRMINPQLKALRKFKARYGTFVVLGNHEFYFGSVVWERRFRRMGFHYLGNTGVKIWGGDVFIAGVPDPRMLKMSPLMKESVIRTLKEKQDGAYGVFVSHSPAFVKELDKGLVDLQISGHTHGGQIFPFHFIAKRMNKGFLAGLYDVSGIKLYVSRGAGGWGPPMRLFAPSEIAVIYLIPAKKAES